MDYVKRMGLPFLFVLQMGVLLLSPAAMAQETAASASDDDCYVCHKVVKESKGYLESAHGKIFTDSPRNQLEAKGCIACHGEASRHKEVFMDEDYKGPTLIKSLKPDSKDVSAVNETCLSCHQGGKQMHWSGSMHDMNKVSCTSCHDIHNKSAKVKEEACLSCHADVRAKMLRSSHMPLNEGKMGCMDCHNAHGSPSEGSLKKPTVNETCFECHAEKRGPFLWEHTPVTESCSTCHDSHGSSQKAMLKVRAPYLCQSCHQIQRHPSSAYDSTRLDTMDNHLIKSGCMNCHGKIHGSNHPSGTMFQR